MVNSILNKLSYTFFLVFLISTIGAYTPSSQASILEMVQSSPTVKLYDFIELALHVTPPKGNVFYDAQVSALITHESGEQFTVNGFADSYDGSLYKVRIGPTKIGNSSYKVTYTTAEGSSSKSGTFRAIRGDNPGFIRINPIYPHHFIWDTGSPYYPLGTTAYGMAGLSDMNEIRTSIDYYKSHGINRVRLLNQGELIDGEFDAQFSSAWHGKLNPFITKNNIFSFLFEEQIVGYKLEHWQKFESILRYLRSQNIIASVILTIDRQGLFPKESSQLEKHYYQYAAARYGAFSNVMFDLGNEHNEFRKVPSWARETAQYIQSINPYNNLISAHAHEKHLYSDPQLDQWVGWQTIQQWYKIKEINQNIIDHREFKRPIINEEYGYESLTIPELNHTLTEQKTWSILMAGGYFTYGSYCKGDFVTGLNTNGCGKLIADGKVRIIQNFLQAISFETLNPHNELSKTGFALSDLENTVVAYEWKGEEVNLTLPQEFKVESGQWFDNDNGQWLDIDSNTLHLSMQSNNFTLKTPNKNKDWLLVLRSKKKHAQLVSVQKR